MAIANIVNTTKEVEEVIKITKEVFDYIELRLSVEEAQVLHAICGHISDTKGTPGMHTGKIYYALLDALCKIKVKNPAPELLKCNIIFDRYKE